MIKKFEDYILEMIKKDPATLIGSGLFLSAYTIFLGWKNQSLIGKENLNESFGYC